MSTTSPSSALRLSNSEALSKSQKAGTYVQKNRAFWSISLPFLSDQDSAELWISNENLLYSCLRTGDDKAARYCIERLVSRFGSDDERIMGLQGLYHEAMAEDHAALLKVLHDYDESLVENPTNTPVKKRRIALLQSLSREGDAINALVDLLTASPTDIEAWAELADLYVSQGLYQQAEFCLEEILLSTPNAWNIHARLGEILFVSAATSQNQIAALAESVRRFCRSIELCNGYVRGYYGLKLSADRLMAVTTAGDQSSMKVPVSGNNHDNLVPSTKILQQLSDKASCILAETGSTDGRNTTDLGSLKELLKSSTTAQHL